MKKLLILILTILAVELDVQTVEAKVVASSPQIKTAADQKTYGRKRFRRKRGFMWGLFKKKNPCGCPSH